MAWAVYARRRLKQGMANRARNPNQPWLWRDDWAAGEVRSTGRANLSHLWCVTLFCSIVSSFVMIPVPAELAKGNRAASSKVTSI